VVNYEKKRSAPRLSRERSTSRLCRHTSQASVSDILSISENDKKGVKDISLYYAYLYCRTGLD
jgi:hypothetical protein